MGDKKDKLDIDESLLCIGDRQEPFSLAFVGTIAASSGYGFQALNGATNPDRSSIDMMITSKNNKALWQDLKIQAKCTYYHEVKGNYLDFKIKKKNFNDILTNRSPHILVVVNVPRPPSEWVIFNEKSCTLLYNCYWYSLKGLEPIDKGSKVLKIPSSNVLNKDSLSRIMGLVSEGKFVSYENKVIDLL